MINKSYKKSCKKCKSKEIKKDWILFFESTYNLIKDKTKFNIEKVGKNF